VVVVVAVVVVVVVVWVVVVWWCGVVAGGGGFATVKRMTCVACTHDHFAEAVGRVTDTRRQNLAPQHGVDQC
jgi:hypothetical protein